MTAESPNGACCGSWLKAGSLFVLVAAGVAGGLYLSGWEPFPRTICLFPESAPHPEPVRFPLSSFDVKDTHETPELAVAPDGRLLLAWPSQTGEGERTLYLTSSTDRAASFAEPRKLATSGISKSVSQMHGKTVTRERKMAPHLAATGSRVVLAWTTAKPDGSDTRLVLAESTDSGATFTEPTPVHGSDAGKPTFTWLAITPAGSVACSWLDSRAKVQQTYAAVRPIGGQTFSPEVLVHAGQDGKGVCPCCPTNAAFAPDGSLFVAFRNVDAGYRDIAISRLKPGATAFEPPVSVVPPTWKFDGCPHDGPSLAFTGDTVHVTWMDSHGGKPRCYYGKAKLADRTFETRELNPAAAGTQGNAKLVADATGGLHAIWEESLGEASAGRAVRYAYSAKADGTFTEPRTLDEQPGKFQTRPAITVSPTGDVFAAWNELSDAGKAVAVMRVSR
jgi:hypothetical protein